jgi:hypothetical protein
MMRFWPSSVHVSPTTKPVIFWLLAKASQIAPVVNDTSAMSVEDQHACFGLGYRLIDAEWYISSIANGHTLFSDVNVLTLNGSVTGKGGGRYGIWRNFSRGRAMTSLVRMSFCFWASATASHSGAGSEVSIASSLCVYTLGNLQGEEGVRFSYVRWT